MAFSKAKLLRFNDIQSCAPPPGAYNPKYDATRAAIYSKDTKEKTSEPPPSPASSCADAKSVHSCVTVPSFRTPTVPKRKKIALFNSVGKKAISTKLFSPRSPSKSAEKKPIITGKNEDVEALREKIVECQNKDETIKDLETQIDDLKQMICNINKEKEELIVEKKYIIEKFNFFQNELQNVTSKLTESQTENKEIYEELNSVKLQLDKLKELEESFDQLQKDLNEELQNKETSLSEVEDKLKEKEQAYVTLEKELIKMKEENLKLIFQYEESLHVQSDLQRRHSLEIESIKKNYQLEIEDLEYEILKEITESTKLLHQTEKDQQTTIRMLETRHETEMEKLKKTYEFQLEALKEETEKTIMHIEETCAEKMKLEEIQLQMEQQDLQTEHELIIKNIREEAEAQIRQSEENCEEKIKLAEMQMEETNKQLELNWQLKFEEQEKKSTEILKECQSIAEFNIIQCEVEKNQIKHVLQEKEETISQLKEENSSLTVKNSELEKSVGSLQTDLSNIIIELNETRENLGTEIDLRQMELDEVLKEKHLYEITLHKTYDTVNALKNRLLHSDRDVEQLKDELECLEMSKLEVESRCIQLNEEMQHINEINEELQLENLLFKEIQDKVASLEQELLGKIDNLKEKSDTEIRKLNKTITEKQTSLDDLNAYVQIQQKVHNDLQLLIADAKNEIERQESEFIDYKFQISRLESSLNSSNKELLNHGLMLEKRNKYVTELEEKLKEKESEINEITNIYKKFVERNKGTEKNYEEVKIKCQNFEKTIAEQNALIGPFRKHLTNLKKNKTIDDKDEYEAKINQQNKTIEKLKQEIANLSKNKRRSKSMAPGDKENICSPVRQTFNTSLLDSPGKSPLKERN